MMMNGLKKVSRIALMNRINIHISSIHGLLKDFGLKLSLDSRHFADKFAQNNRI